MERAEFKQLILNTVALPDHNYKISICRIDIIENVYLTPAFWNKMEFTEFHNYFVQKWVLPYCEINNSHLKNLSSVLLLITCSIQSIQYRAHYARKNTKAQTKRFSLRSFQHCLYFPNVSTESVTSRCIGHRWLTALSVAQIQLGKVLPLFIFKSLLWAPFFQHLKKMLLTCQWTLFSILKESKYFSCT